MSEYEALREDIARVGDSLSSYARTVDVHVDAIRIVTDQLWADNAELRDELHAVANRLENLTRAVTTGPAEVAQAIVNDANRSAVERIIPSNTPHKDRLERAMKRFQEEGGA